MSATEQNDLSAYARLLADDGKFTDAFGKTLPKDQWVDALKPEFTARRETRFLNVFAGYTPGGYSRRFMFHMMSRTCQPNVMECFPVWRTQVITVSAGKITEVQESSEYILRRTAQGKWTYLE